MSRKYEREVIKTLIAAVSRGIVSKACEIFLRAIFRGSDLRSSVERNFRKIKYSPEDPRTFRRTPATGRRCASTCPGRRSLNLLVQTSARQGEHKKTTGHRGVSFTVPPDYITARSRRTPLESPDCVSGASLFRETPSRFASAKFSTRRRFRSRDTSPRQRRFFSPAKRAPCELSSTLAGTVGLASNRSCGASITRELRVCAEADRTSPRSSIFHAAVRPRVSVPRRASFLNSRNENREGAGGELRALRRVTWPRLLPAALVDPRCGHERLADGEHSRGIPIRARSHCLRRVSARQVR